MSGTISINASNTTIWLNPGQSYALTGSNDVFYCESGSSLTLVGGSDTLIFGDYVQATVYGTAEVVSEAGAGDVLSINNSGSASDRIGLNGTDDYVGLLAGANFTVLNDGAGDMVAMLANTAVTVTGSGGGVYLSGSGDSVTTSNETIGTTANDQAESVTGTGDTIFESANNAFNVAGGSDAVDMTGANDYAGLLGGSGDIVYNDNAGDTVGLAANIAATVTGSGGGVYLSGSGDSVTTSNETIGTTANDQGESVTGTGDTIFESANNAFNVSGGSDAVDMTGANDYAGLLGGSGNIVYNDNAGDTVTMLANTAVTVTGSGGGVYLGGSGDSVTTSNETIGTAANDRNESVTGTGDTIFESANNAFNVAGGSDTIHLGSAGDYLGLLGGSGYSVTATGDTINTSANTSLNLAGGNDSVGLGGTGDYLGLLGGTGYSVTAIGDTINTSANTSLNLAGGNDSVGLGGTGDYLGLLGGSGYVVGATGDTINTSANTSLNLAGGNDSVGLGGTGDHLGLLGGSGYAVTAIGDTINTLANTSLNLAGGNDSVNLGGTGDDLGLLSGSGYVVNNDNTGDQVDLAGAVTATVNGSGGSIGADGIDAIYNAVLDRDMTPAELTAAEALLATGTSLNALQAQVANSAEAQSDMASTYAAVSGSGAIQALLDAQPQSTSQLLNVDDVQAQGANAPAQAEFNAFADAMSTSYGAPIELFSVDPNSGAQTELADTSSINLLAELPVLETQANGANLSLQLADGTQVQFASTARTATFLYALAVQQTQGTQFVTDTYNLDMQWLNTVDQPLLDEAAYWSERAAAEASAHPERTIEDNTQASMALQIAAEAPGSRQDMTVTINNAATGHPTQITVYADGDGSTIHDVAPSIGGYLESAVSIALNVAAAVSGQAYLYFAAAALDAAKAGQDFSNGQDLQAVLSLAQAVAAGITGAAGTLTTAGTLTPPLTAQIITAAAQDVGGVYGIVQSAENGNAAGILAGALEDAAAAATGIGLYDGGQTQAMLQSISTVLTTAGLATTVASDFASGNLGQGLVDSLNLYLPIIAQDYVATQATITPGTVSPDNISPTPDMLGTPQHLAFVGGFFDYTQSLLSGLDAQTTYNEYLSYAAAHPGVDVQYFTWDNAAGLAAWGNQVDGNGGQITLIGHSYGAATAASVVASGLKVQTLVTLDPVSYLQPDFHQVAANSGQWLNFVAAGGGLTLPNAIAGIGGAWNGATMGYATSTTNVSTDHGGIENGTMYNQLLGPVH
ncbi:beta strand repeat-containing protein [Rhodopila sp.]|uniref:beta strand repeat-containing protein n=1 Tax=Rhodopila sp. TaxID=2480087 RepID=UPI003D115BD0